MSDAHGAAGSHVEEMSHATGQKSSSRRLVLLTVIMVGFAAASFIPSLFSRGGGTDLGSTGTNFTTIFIPVWLTLTISVVIISMWFAKFLMEAERGRDSEAPGPAHSEH